MTQNGTITKELIFIIALFTMVLISTNIFAKTVYMGPNETNKTLKQAFSVMIQGDTLIIRDGVYTGSDNVINDSNYPPPGISKDQPTRIMAENSGMVFFDGENNSHMFYFSGRTGGTSYIRNWEFVGIQWVRSSSYGLQLTGGDHDNFTTGDYGSSLPDSYITFKECGFHGEENSVQMAYMKYVLFEDCWTWGNGRYGYNFYLNDYVVVRRNVDRRDNLNAIGSHPSASYITYASHYVEFQNCISIDIDNSLWDRVNGVSYHDPYGGFYVRNSYKSRRSDDTHFRGCMVINYNASFPSNSPSRHSGWYFQEDPTDTTLENCIVWGSSKGMITNGVNDDIDIDKCTVGNSANQTEGTWHYAFGDRNNSGYLNVTNSVAYNNPFLIGLYQVSSKSGYNNVFGNESDTVRAATSTKVDPKIRYIVRVERDSPNYDTGSTGSKGATVLNKYGIDGTFYGEPGYTTLTPNKLWPWPNEDIIMASFRKDYGTTNEKRGFCADGQTLTKYIWEIAGNPIPAELGGTDEGGNALPVANAGADETLTDLDMDGVQQVTLSGSGSSDSDGTITNFEWREGNTVLATQVSATLDMAVGVHTVTLSVTDNDGAQATDSTVITINAGTATGNQAPIANAGADQTLTDWDMDGVQQVTLDGSGSSDSDGTITSYQWKEGSTVISTQEVVTTDLAVGAHTISLSITDNDGAQVNDTVVITINAGAAPGGSGETQWQINFQPAGTNVPQGFQADSGSVYNSSRGYGWSRDISAQAKERNLLSDKTLDTFLYADADEPATWEIDLPNGNYLVSFSVGDADKPQGDQVVVMEGQTLINQSTDTNQLFVSLQDQPVTISDGRLTLQIGGGVRTYEYGLTTLNYIKIDPNTSGTVSAPSAPIELRIVTP